MTATLITSGDHVRPAACYESSSSAVKHRSQKHAAFQFASPLCENWFGNERGNFSYCTSRVAYSLTADLARTCRSSSCPDHPSTAWLISLVVFSCLLWSPSCDTRGPSVDIEAVDVPYQGPFHFFSHCWLYLTFVLS